MKIFFYRIQRRRKKARSSLQYKKEKENARLWVRDRLDHFREMYAKIDPSLHIDLRHNKLSIRNQRFRWGSCSSRKNLNFNYRIMSLDPELRDYVIVHELCHLKELHHGEKFWQLVKMTLPDAEKLHQITRKTRIN